MKIPKGNSPENVVDLSDILGQQTETKNPGATTEKATGQEQEPASTPNMESQELPLQDTTDTVFFSPEPPKAPEPPKPEIKVDHSEQAKIMVMTFDLAGQITLPVLHKRKMFTLEERKQLKEIKVFWKMWSNGKLKEETLSEDELRLIKIYDEFREITDQIPFSEKEIDMISNPLALMLQKYNMQSGPEASFIFAIVTVMGSRIMPLLIND